LALARYVALRDRARPRPAQPHTPSPKNHKTQTTSAHALPWIRRLFKQKQKLWAEIDDTGEYILTDGLVQTRYTQDDDARIYRVAPIHLAPIPEAPTATQEKVLTALPTGQLDLFGVAAPPAHSAPPKPAAAAPAATATPASAPTPIIARTAQKAPPMEFEEGGVIESFVLPDELANVAPPPEGVVEVYTDGACQGNPGPCGYAVIIRQGEVYREFREYLGQGTNNIAELTAIEAALDALPPTNIPVRVHSDSAYAIGVLTQNWKPKANVELIERIKRRMRAFGKLTFHKVKGHCGHPLNERVDRLAVLSVEENL
jgi:ribonuclease HI